MATSLRYGFTRPRLSAVTCRRMRAVELLQVLVMHPAAALVVIPLGGDEDGEENRREDQAADGGDGLGHQVRERREQHDQEHDEQADGELNVAPLEIEGDHELAMRAIFEPQHDHRQRFENEAPDDAERVRFAEQDHVAAAHHDRKELHAGDQVQQAVVGAEPRMGLEEPIGEHAVLGHAAQDAVRADDRRVDRARKNQESRRPRQTR